MLMRARLMSPSGTEIPVSGAVRSLLPHLASLCAAAELVYPEPSITREEVR